VDLTVFAFLAVYVTAEIVDAVGDGILDVLGGAGDSGADVVSGFVGVCAGFGRFDAAVGSQIVDGVLGLAPGLLGCSLDAVGGSLVGKVLVADGFAGGLFNLAAEVFEFSCDCIFAHGIPF
jgi:hypothetical protein